MWLKLKKIDHSLMVRPIVQNIGLVNILFLSLICPCKMMFNGLEKTVFFLIEVVSKEESTGKLKAWQIFWMRANHLYTSKLLHKSNPQHWKCRNVSSQIHFKSITLYLARFSVIIIDSWCFLPVFYVFMPWKTVLSQTEWLSRGRLELDVHTSERESVTEG